jgi:hypothetical protein
MSHGCGSTIEREGWRDDKAHGHRGRAATAGGLEGTLEP